MDVVAAPLQVEAFAPFGQIVAADLHAGKSANQGTAVRFDWIANVAGTRPSARANVAVFRSVAKSLPFAVKLLERHPCSSQMFIPMKCARFMVIVCPSRDDGLPHLPGLQAFVCEAGQGFNYNPNVWHHPIIALDAPAELMMLAFEDGSARDCEEWTLPEPAMIIGAQRA